ncbi:MAG: hypothetical protein QOF36_2606 [Microbacteriaceae bacterium]|nr:hypothetical protein [Microbacteriaceae bacterium]
MVRYLPHLIATVSVALMLWAIVAVCQAAQHVA